jgi:acyl carrier protein
LSAPNDSELADLKSRLRAYIAENLLFSEDGFKHGDDVSLLEAGIIDSLGVMELVAFVEKHLGVKVPDADVTPEHFDSINRLAAYVHRRRAASGA